MASVFRVGREIINISNITHIIARPSITHWKHPFILEIEKKNPSVIQYKSYAFFGNVQHTHVCFKLKYENVTDMMKSFDEIRNDPEFSGIVTSHFGKMNSSQSNFTMTTNILEDLNALIKETGDLKK